jgi:hypothetical protein
MIKSIKPILWIMFALLVAFATRPAAAYTIQWNNSWQWYDYAGSQNNIKLDYDPKCMGSTVQTSTGIGVWSPTKANWNGKVMYWLDGGGFCYDNQSCNVNAAPSLANLIGGFASCTNPQAPFVFRKTFAYSPDFTTDRDSFAGWDINGMWQYKPFLGQGIFDHSVGATNPFYQYIQVFVPNCTGDAHLGDNTDSTDGGHRTHSGKIFSGLVNAKNAVSYTDAAVRAQASAPSQSVMVGGSAGGIGVMMDYGWFRQILPSGERIVTISDGGPLYWSGDEASGSSWGNPGWQTGNGWLGPAGLGLPPGGLRGSTLSWGVPAKDVTYQEALMAQAWGNNWASPYASSLAITPASSPNAFYPMQYILWNNISHATTDKFFLIDSSDDFIDPWFTSMYPNVSQSCVTCNPACGAGQVCISTGSSGSGSVCSSQTTANAQAEITYLFGSSVFCQIASATSNSLSGAEAWNLHHGFLTNDVSTWGTTADACGSTTTIGSGVRAFLTNIGSYL